jgi:GNAT superfamily N-acetyltransferase
MLVFHCNGKLVGRQCYTRFPRGLRLNANPTHVDCDWQSVLEICLLAFALIHESFETRLGNDLFRLVYPDWKTSHERYLLSLAETEKGRIFVAEESGVVVGFIHYEVAPDGQSVERLGWNAIHPAHQRKGFGTLMYGYVLDVMRVAGLKFAQVGTLGATLARFSARCL